MISLYILITLFIITAASLIVCVCFGFPKSQFLRKTILTGVALCIAFSIACICIHNGHENHVDTLIDEYNELTLYHSTIDNSTNEYVRYDYYNKVLSFNAELQQLQKCHENSWFGWLYPNNWENIISLIDFQLHGDIYNG